MKETSSKTDSKSNKNETKSPKISSGPLQGDLGGPREQFSGWVVNMRHQLGPPNSLKVNKNTYIKTLGF